jgi:hypothetical protein
MMSSEVMLPQCCSAEGGMPASLEAAEESTRRASATHGGALPGVAAALLERMRSGEHVTAASAMSSPVESVQCLFLRVSFCPSISPIVPPHTPVMPCRAAHWQVEVEATSFKRLQLRRCVTPSQNRSLLATVSPAGFKLSAAPPAPPLYTNAGVVMAARAMRALLQPTSRTSRVPTRPPSPSFLLRVCLAVPVCQCGEAVLFFNTSHA